MWSLNTFTSRISLASISAPDFGRVANKNMGDHADDSNNLKFRNPTCPVSRTGEERLIPEARAGSSPSRSNETIKFSAQVQGTVQSTSFTITGSNTQPR